MLKELLTNEIHLPITKYAAILGLSPSNGARSPHLWNAAFELGNINVKMFPLDVNSSNLIAVLTYLHADSNFIGGAITAPHKEMVAKWLGQRRLSKEAFEIGAVNCIYRDELGQLFGTNTDGEAALFCLQNSYGPLMNKSILQLGCGGAGKAASIYFTNSGAKVTICVREPNKHISFAVQNGISLVEWDRLGDSLKRFDIIVNATSIGSRALGMQDHCPFTEDQIKSLEGRTFIYDIVYDPRPTKLISLADASGLLVLDGGEMNLEQAALGFMYVIKDIYELGYEEVKKIMFIKKQQLDSL